MPEQVADKAYIQFCAAGQISEVDKTHSEGTAMVDESEIIDSRLSSLRQSETPSKRFLTARWLCLAIAFILVLAALPIAWSTFELANQEYLHLWNSDKVIHDLEFNGVSVSNGDAIRMGATSVLIQLSLASMLFMVPRFLARMQGRDGCVGRDGK